MLVEVEVEVVVLAQVRLPGKGMGSRGFMGIGAGIGFIVGMVNDVGCCNVDVSSGLMATMIISVVT